MSEEEVKICIHCKKNPVEEGLRIANCCRPCVRPLMRVILAQAGRDPDTGNPMEAPDPLAWLQEGEEK